MEIGLYSYPHHIGDFVKDTARLTDGQAMTYLRLLWHYYDTEMPLPKDINKLCFMLGASPEDAQLILEHFFDEHPDCWRHKRCDAEIAAYRNRQDHGRKAAKSRWNNAPSMPTASPEHPPSMKKDANRKPITDNRIDIKPKERQGALQCPPGVSVQVWSDFMAVRKAKRSPVTETALRGIEREATNAGWTLEQALAECAARGWVGFKAEWVRNSMREVLDDSRLKMIANTNRVIQEMRDAQSNSNVADHGKTTLALRGSVDAEMGGLGPIDADV
jgi:uncharacterized protein YdaU (DUF1376 family)